MYMVSIGTTIYSKNFYNLSFSLLSYALFLYNFCSYNENYTIQYIRGRFSWVFPPTTLSYLFEIKVYNYFTFITLNAFNRKMRAMLKIRITIPKTFKNNYIFLAIKLMFLILNFKTSSKCALVHIQLSSIYACLQCSCIIMITLENISFSLFSPNDMTMY